jgi:hypothetical protein
MGLFSSKYVTQVGTQVMRVIEDDMVPTSIKSGVIKSFFYDDASVSDYVLEELVASIGVKAESMYAYAERAYAHGLPSGEIYSSTQGRMQVEAVIEQIEGQQVLMDYSHYGPANATHVGWIKLINQFGYNPQTNELTILSQSKGQVVYLKDMQVIVPSAEYASLEPGVLERWGNAPNAGYTPQQTAIDGLMGMVKASPVIVSNTATELQLLVTAVWQTGANAWSKVDHQETFTLLLNEFSDEADFFHAKYYVNGQAKYWMYQNKTGTYPTLDSVYVDGPAESGSYFPFAYFRYNKQSEISNKTTAAYKTSKKLVKYLGIDYDAIAESIDDNPDIGDVEQAMMVFGVPSVSTNQMECRYLFDYFDNLHYVQGGETSSALNAISKLLTGAGSAKTIIIKDARFKMALTNTGITKRMVAGSIGVVGSYTATYATQQIVTQLQDSESGSTYDSYSTVGIHSYRHQVAPGLYEEVQVQNLKMKYYVYGDYTTTGDETDDILLIPIDRSISSTYSMAEREELYARSLHFVFNSRVVTKVKWYQTGVFRALLFIVAVVITIYNPPAGLAAMNLTGAALVIAAIVINLVIGVIVQAAFKLFVKVLGQDIATAIAIVALIYGAYRFTTEGMAAIPTAEKMLMLSNGLQSAVIQSKFSDLLDQQNLLNLYVDEQTKLLDKANELLENSHLLNPLVIFGEKPEDFYNRTVHFGNIGTLGITAVSSYVDIALTLPKLNDTLGEISNERLS